MPRTDWATAACAALLCASWSPASRAAGTLNDSGLTVCLYTDGSSGSACDGTGQDAAFGRDLSQPDEDDGRAGFSFTKIGPQYTRLSPSAPSWPCVLDEVTGLVWEVKTLDGGLQDVNQRYTNFNDLRAGDASSYVAAVNAQTLCGQSDWRLPTGTELQGVMDYGRQPGTPSIDTNWFGPTAASWTWSANAYVGAASSAWTLDFSAAHVYFAKRRERSAVRLVRSGQSPAVASFVALGDEVRDSSTGLTWSRCSEGQRWDGVGCSGDVLKYKWQQAVDRAKQQAAATGVAWRLPNPKELASIVDAQRFTPTIDTETFPATPATWYWTSSFDRGGSKTAFFVNFQHGGSYDHDRKRTYAVRLVRDTP